MTAGQRTTEYKLTLAAMAFGACLCAVGVGLLLADRVLAGCVTEPLGALLVGLPPLFYSRHRTRAKVETIKAIAVAPKGI